MAPGTYRSKYPAKTFVASVVALAALCWGGARMLRGQESNASSAATGDAQGAQQAQQPTIKSDVRIVLVDVVVTGAKGAPAGGLKKEDFQVSEDGKAQTVSFFDEHTDGK
jgi:hypothetical protein